MFQSLLSPQDTGLVRFRKFECEDCMEGNLSGSKYVNNFTFSHECNSLTKERIKTLTNTVSHNINNDFHDGF